MVGEGGETCTDWVQREIELGFKQGKLIIPIRTPDFDIETEFASVPADVAMLRKLNILELHDAYFSASIDKVIECIAERRNDTNYIGD